MPRAPQVILADFETKGIQSRPKYPPKPGSLALKWPDQSDYKLMAWGHGDGTRAFDNNCTEKEARGELKKAQDITFRIGGKAFTLTPAQYIIPQNQYGVWGLSTTTGLHYTYLSTSYFGLDVILGQKFLEHFYSVFDTNHNRIGLAPRK